MKYFKLYILVSFVFISLFVSVSVVHSASCINGETVIVPVGEQNNGCVGREDEAECTATDYLHMNKKTTCLWSPGPTPPSAWIKVNNSFLDSLISYGNSANIEWGSTGAVTCGVFANGVNLAGAGIGISGSYSHIPHVGRSLLTTSN